MIANYKDLKKIKIYTILIHGFIIIGAGHGIGVLLFFDFLGMQSLLNNEITFNISADYQDRLMLVGLISIIGKLVLIISFFITARIFKNILSLFGVLLLWISVYVLSSGSWSYNGLNAISFFSSIPFLIASLFLVFYNFKNLKN